MVRTGLLFVVVTAGINLCFGQMYWTRSYAGETYPAAMQPTKDGNYIIAGCTHNPQNNSSILGWFAKINPNGDTLWTKNFGVLNSYLIYEMESIDGDFFLLVGECASDISFNHGLVVKINTNGDVIWTKTYEKSGEVTTFHAIHKCTDGNFLIAGTSEERNAVNLSGSLVKITPDGDTLWTRSTGVEMLLSIQTSSDENYLITGSFKNTVSGKDEILLLKISNSGEIVWTKTFASSRNQTGCTVRPTGDGNYLILGYSNWQDSIGSEKTVGRYDGLLMKITPEGNSIWTRIYSTPAMLNIFTDILSSTDSNFVITGYKYSSTAYKKDYNDWLLKINQKGDTVWTRSSSVPQDHYFLKILPAGDGKYVVLGSVEGIWTLSCIIEDRYANKDSLFSFKIPTRGLDSLNCGYQPLKVPPGMTVSAGGTVSWTPQTDSSYLENAKYIVADDQGRKDTLSLNIFVNMQNQPSHIRTTHQVAKDKASGVFTIASYLERGKVQFNFPASVELLSIYDMSGRLVDRITPVNPTGRQTILWPASGTGFHSGQYIARAVDGKKTEAKVFMLGR